MLPTQTINGVVVPDFTVLTPKEWDHYLSEAFQKAEADGQRITHNEEAPTFSNTFLAMERRTKDIWAVEAPFISVQTAHNTDEMQALAKKWTPQFQDLYNRFMGRDLALRCRAAFEASPGLDDADQRLCEETLKQFERTGAFLEDADRARFLEISNELSTLGLTFSEIHQANSNVVVFVDAALPGVDPVFARDAVKSGEEAGRPGKAAIGMNASEVETILGSCSDRATREAVWRGFSTRGQGTTEGDTQTQPIIEKILILRQEMATLMGFENWAALATEQRMAKNAETAKGLVADTWQQLSPVLARELATIETHARTNGFDGPMAPWDLDYWLAQTRSAQFSIDDEQVRRHLPLPIVRAGAFATAESLFGISFEPCEAPTYHSDAKPFLVRDRDAKPLGLLYIDDAMRDTKSSGAWMEMLLPADRIDEGRLPVILNVCNFPSATEDRPALLSMDEAVTAFHELGHALHALLTTARYPTQAGTMVYGDFVELQSQLLENWIRQPEALARIALDWNTGNKMDISLARQVNDAMQFGQSIDKARYLMSAWIDLEAHARPQDAGRDPVGFEGEIFSEMQAPGMISPRHRLTHFTHLFSGAMSGYSAGYYSYLWAEVLEADAFEAWQESGDLFDESLGQKARDTIYSRGNEVAPDALYRQFRGRDADPAALLRRMGADQPAARVVSSPRI